MEAERLEAERLEAERLEAERIAAAAALAAVAKPEAVEAPIFVEEPEPRSGSPARGRGRAHHRSGTRRSRGRAHGRGPGRHAAHARAAGRRRGRRGRPGRGATRGGRVRRGTARRAWARGRRAPSPPARRALPRLPDARSSATKTRTSPSGWTRPLMRRRHRRPCHRLPPLAGTLQHAGRRRNRPPRGPSRTAARPRTPSKLRPRPRPRLRSSRPSRPTRSRSRMPLPRRSSSRPSRSCLRTTPERCSSSPRRPRSSRRSPVAEPEVEAPVPAPEIVPLPQTIIAASVDVGATSAHLLVAAVTGHRVEPLLDESAFLGLGDRVATNGYLGRDARDELVATRSPATPTRRAASARRRSRSSAPSRCAAPPTRAPLIHAVEAGAGAPLHVLDHDEEAMLTLLGVTGGRPVTGAARRRHRRRQLGDRHRRPETGPVAAVGLRLGSAALTQEHVQGRPADASRRSTRCARPRRRPRERARREPGRDHRRRWHRVEPAQAAPGDGDRPDAHPRAGSPSPWPCSRSSAAARPPSATSLRPQRARVLPAGRAHRRRDPRALRHGPAPRLDEGIREGMVLAAATAGPEWRDRLPRLSSAGRRSAGLTTTAALPAPRPAPERATDRRRPPERAPERRGSTRRATPGRRSAAAARAPARGRRGSARSPRSRASVSSPACSTRNAAREPGGDVRVVDPAEVVLERDDPLDHAAPTPARAPRARTPACSAATSRRSAGRGAW